MTYTAKKIEDAQILIEKMANHMTDNQKFVVYMALKSIAKAALSDYMKANMDAAYRIEAELEAK